jgi:L-lactate dehydrogenase (cytochrome)
MTARPRRSPRRLSRCFSIADLRHLAWRKLPAPLFHYIDGGADDEVTLRRNTAAFDDYALLPRTLCDVSAIDLSTRVLGQKLALPFFCAPTGMSRLFHIGAERAVARAAAAAGTLYALSTMATTTLEDVAVASDGPKMFQVYLFRDKGLTAEFVQRCIDARYDALCLTIDTPLAGNRERDRVTGMTMPPRFTLASLASFAAHPGWALDYLRDGDFNIRNVAHRVDALAGGGMSLIDYVNSQFDRTASWADAAALRAMWPGPFVIKGVQSITDARRAVDAGASALMISNHGGRQLDGAMAPVELVARIRDALGDGVELIVDGGVRRGTHVLKAIALGANACSIGRAYLYGLAAGGEAGVAHALALLRDEIARDMALMGVTRIGDVGGELVDWLGHRQERTAPRD